jgi:glutathione S-transferase
VSLHLGIKLDLEVVDLAAGAQREPVYLAINPNGKVPCLVDGKDVIWESGAIQEFLVARHGESNLLPENPMARAQANRWRFWAETSRNRHLGTFAWQRIFAPMMLKQPADEDLVAEAEKQFRASAVILEGHLEEGSWICGENLTLADFALASMLTYWEKSGVPLKDFPGIHAWYGRVGEMSCWKETMPPILT